MPAEKPKAAGKAEGRIRPSPEGGIEFYFPLGDDEDDSITIHLDSFEDFVGFIRTAFRAAEKAWPGKIELEGEPFAAPPPTRRLQ